MERLDTVMREGVGNKTTDDSQHRISMDHESRILPLSPEAISQIHSSKHINSLQEVVLSLLENSLDAQATRIDISVNVWRGACTVEDNGVGIPHPEFAKNGGLAKMYCTSKRPLSGLDAPDEGTVHSSTGTFLAELGALSLLRISSKCANIVHVGSLILHRGRVIAGPPTEPVSLDLASGTCVAVDDLFGTMPVRVKQRASNRGLGNDGAKMWQELKRGIAAVLLAWPHPCSIRLRDDAVPGRALNISGQHPSVSGFLTDKGLHHLSGRPIKFDMRDTLPILFQTGLASPSSKNKWIPLSATTSLLSLKGLICAEPAPTRACQFIAIGIRSCASRNDLHEAVNRIFSQSNFGMTNEIDGNAAGSPSSIHSNIRSKQKESVGSNRHTAKGVDRNPMYVLQLAFKQGHGNTFYDVEHISNATLKSLLDILEAAVTAWLVSNHLRPRKRRKRQREDRGSPVLSSASSRSLSTRVGTPESTVHSQIASVSISHPCTDQSDLGPRQFSSPEQIRATGSTALAIAAHSPVALTRIRAGNTTGKLPQIDHAVVRSESQRNLDTTSSTDATTIPDLVTHPDEPVKASETVVGKDITLLGSGACTRLHATGLSACSMSSSYSGDCIRCGSLSSDDFGIMDEANLSAARKISAPAGIDYQMSQKEVDTFAWTDPVTNTVLQVNSRTGVVLPSMHIPCKRNSTFNHTCTASLTRACIDMSLTSAGKPLLLARRNKVSTIEKRTSGIDNEAPWLPGFLMDWDNPTFTSQLEDPIPVASFQGPGVVEDNIRSAYTAYGVPDSRATIGSLRSQRTLKLSKIALQHAIVIGQVDSKFILCKLPRSALDRDGMRELLVLVDQHAASERIILEQLFDGFCTDMPGSENIVKETSAKVVKSSSLVLDTTRAKILDFEIPAQDFALFSQHRDHFRTLGMIYETVTTSDRAAPAVEAIPPIQHRLKVTHLPAAIAERCTNFPSLCIDMLRSELWQLADGTKRPLQALPVDLTGLGAESTPYWPSILPVLPAKLVSLLHSRACRSAVMFNDPLTMEQCKDLVGKLSQCVFPFICAHGRVAMVPLGGIGEMEESEPLAGLGEFQSSTLSEPESHQDCFGSRRSEDVCTPADLHDWISRRGN